MTTDADAVDLIKAMPVFAQTDDSVVDELSRIATVRMVAAGTQIFSEGDLHNDLYFVSSGTVALNMVTANCGQQPILTVGHGDLLAWSAFIGDGRMTASAVASTPTELIVLPGDRLRALCDADHDVGYAIALCFSKLIARRLLATRLQLLDLYHP